jgi:hypothetical protein
MEAKPCHPVLQGLGFSAAGYFSIWLHPLPPMLREELATSLWAANHLYIASIAAAYLSAIAV